MQTVGNYISQKCIQKYSPITHFSFKMSLTLFPLKGEGTVVSTMHLGTIVFTAATSKTG